MIDTDKYEGHTPADQWTIYKMGADKPYHAVRFGQRGLDLELEFGADAQLIADAPLLLAEVKRLREEVKVLSKYRDIVTEFDDALLADGDTDIRWSAIYDERVFK